jgi:hypothetical protein
MKLLRRCQEADRTRPLLAKHGLPDPGETIVDKFVPDGQPAQADAVPKRREDPRRTAEENSILRPDGHLLAALA